MALVALSYPTFSTRDLLWMQEMRAEHDRLYETVEPHFTFVFPVTGVPEAEFAREIASQASGARRIPFLLEKVAVEKDSSSDYTNVYLVPTEGYGEITELHDRLYRGTLRPKLRPDLPYVPHITVGNSLDPGASTELAEQIGAEPFSVPGAIEVLHVASYEGQTVTAIMDIKLA